MEDPPPPPPKPGRLLGFLRRSKTAPAAGGSNGHASSSNSEEEEVCAAAATSGAAGGSQAAAAAAAESSARGGLSAFQQAVIMGPPSLVGGDSTEAAHTPPQHARHAAVGSRANSPGPDGVERRITWPTYSGPIPPSLAGSGSQQQEQQRQQEETAIEVVPAGFGSLQGIVTNPLFSVSAAGMASAITGRAAAAGSLRRASPQSAGSSAQHGELVSCSGDGAAGMRTWDCVPSDAASAASDAI